MQRMRRLAALLALPGVLVLACASGSITEPAREPEVATPFHVIGHRGAAGHAPENTLAGVERALALGAFEVELDVQRSADAVLVLFHDATLEGKTKLRGRVADHPASVLLATDVGSWFDAAHPDVMPRYAGEPIASLASVLDAHGSALIYHLEIKGDEPELPVELVAAVRARSLEHWVTITSFSFEQLERAHAAAPDIELCWLVRDDGTEVVGASERERRSLLAVQREQADATAAAGFAYLGIRAGALSREIVDYARSVRGLKVRSWGVRSLDDMEHAIAMGANGMTIDWPEQLLARLRALGVEPIAPVVPETAR